MATKGASAGILTFLIADIRGYTSFTQQHGDEAAARLASKFAEVSREGIESHAGELTELRGDEALAVFRSPRAALRAAADLQMVFADESALDPDLPLPVGIGLDAGEAVEVQGGYRGGALNLAARLCSRASAGEVLVSQGVAHLARAVEGIALVEHGDLEMKGLQEPVRVLRMPAPAPSVGVPASIRDVPAALRTVTPIFGRDVQLRRLRWMWRMARRGKGRVVAIIGPAGIGKTRLLAELASTVAAGGGDIDYTSFASATSADTDRWRDNGSRLLVLDDLESAAPDSLPTVAGAASTDRSLLVALAFNDESATPELLTAVHALTLGEEGILRPPPLEREHMLEIARLYLGDAAGSVPPELLVSTGGIPRKVHEDVSAWAHAQAARRLGALASQAASERGGLRSVEADLAGSVVNLQLVREQARLFGVGPGRHAAEPEQPPYRGLASFDVSDAEFFFGRERLVAELISRLAGAPLLGVVGPSGSGKSSAVRAGLVPALTTGVLPGSEKWTVALLRPGEHPLRAVERALYAALPRPVIERLDDAQGPLTAVREILQPSERVVLVIDQFEEAFTACTDDGERAAFLAAIAEAANDPRGNVIVVVAVRADYYGRCAADAHLAELLAANQVLVGPMISEEYRRAIVQPALRVGVNVEPELVDDLIADVLGEPGALPLLSTTLRELWGRREGRTIHRHAYLATGGVRGAVARLAEDVYSSFDEQQQAVERSIMLRLAAGGEGEAVVRRRVALSEFDIERKPAIGGVLDVLANRRLVTVSQGIVEVAHEALLREWPRLRDWLEEDREGRRLHGHLTSSAREWAERGHDAAELYRGARLSAALDWTTQHNLELNELEREFVTTSRAQSQQELHRQRRQNRRLRGLLAGAAALLIVAIAAGSFAFVQSRTAQDEARIALARQLGAEALSAPRIDQAMLLAREAVLLDDSRQTEGTLLATLLRSPAVAGTFAMPIQLRPLQTALSPDGATLAVSANDGSLHFFDTHTFKESRPPLAGYGGFGPDTDVYAGGFFVAPYQPPGNAPPTLDVLDAQTMRRVQRLQFSDAFLNLHTGPLDPVFVSPDGRSVYFAFTLVNADGSNSQAFLDSWDVATGNRTEVPLGSNGIDGTAVLPGNRVLVVTDTAAITLGATTLRVIQSVALPAVPGFGTVSPDGRTLASASGSQGVRSATFALVDLASGRSIPAAGGHAAPINAISYTSDGRFIVTSGEDAKVIIWDAASATQIETLTGHSGRIVGQAISADGRTLYTSSLDGVVFRWDLGNTGRFGRSFSVSTGPLVPLGTRTPALAVSPDGTRFAARSAPGQVGIFAVSDLHREAAVPVGGGAEVVALAWSSAQELAVASSSGVEVWLVGGSPSLERTLAGVPGDVRALAFSPDGSMVAAATEADPMAGRLGVWDAHTGQLKAQFVPNRDAVVSIAYDSAGRTLAAGTVSGRIVVVDASSGHLLQTLGPVSGPVVAVAFRAVGTLVTGSNAGIVQHWNTQTGAELGHAVLTEAAPVSSVAIAPGGSAFATSGGSSGDLKVWDDATLQQFGATFPGSAGLWGHAEYTPDGSSLIVVYGDGSGAMWPVSLNAWMQHACQVAGRNFTHEEWSRFVPDHDYAQTCPQFPAG